MRFGHQGGQAAGGDVGIDLRGGDVGVAKHLLQGAQIGAAIQQVRGKGVAQNVRRDARRIDPGLDRGVLQELDEALARKVVAVAPLGEEAGR